MRLATQQPMGPCAAGLELQIFWGGDARYLEGSAGSCEFLEDAYKVLAVTDDPA
jgi:hypothetical protein